LNALPGNCYTNFIPDRLGGKNKSLPIVRASHKIAAGQDQFLAISEAAPRP
jgi:hypothetical protein